jgi:hypothetical protein
MAYLWMLVGCFSFAWMGQFAGLLHSRCDWRVVALARGGLAFIFALSLARMSGAETRAMASSRSMVARVSR